MPPGLLILRTVALPRFPEGEPGTHRCREGTRAGLPAAVST